MTAYMFALAGAASVPSAIVVMFDFQHCWATKRYVVEKIALGRSD